VRGWAFKWREASRRSRIDQIRRAYGLEISSNTSSMKPWPWAIFYFDWIYRSHAQSRRRAARAPLPPRKNLKC